MNFLKLICLWEKELLEPLYLMPPSLPGVCPVLGRATAGLRGAEDPFPHQLLSRHPSLRERIFLVVFLCFTVSRFKLPWNLSQGVWEGRGSSLSAGSARFLFPSPVVLLLYNLKSLQIAALYILFRTFSCNQWKR